MNLKQKLIPLLFLVITLFLLFNKTTKIECKIEHSNCPDELIENTNKLKGSSFFFNNIQKKLDNNKNDDSIYILQSTAKKFPGTLVLSFKQEEIKYSLVVEDITYYIGNTGKTIPATADNSKVISYTWKNDDLIIQDSIVQNSHHKKFLTIADELSKNKFDNMLITWVSDSEILLDIPDKPLFIFDTQTIETEVKKVDIIINARELDEIEEPILEIDMRFDLPVLRTRQ